MTKENTKIELQFMVVPELLAQYAYVPNPVRVKIIDPEAIFLTGLLGESGRKLVKAGIEFYFEKGLAQKLIEKKIAEEVPQKDGLHEGLAHSTKAFLAANPDFI